MARTGRPKLEILTLTVEERAALERMAARPRSARHMAFRAKVVLRCADGGSNKDVARELRTHRETVGRWRSRFIAERLDGLHDEPRPGAARKITDDAIEAVVTKTLESTPRGRTHWSTRSMSFVDWTSLASLRASAASGRDDAALARPTSRREGPRYRRAVHEPARQRRRLVYRREVADPSA